jgi:hypothetical protein
MSNFGEVTLGQAYQTVRDTSMAVATRVRNMMSAWGGVPKEATSEWRRRVMMATVITAGVACLYYMMPGILAMFGIALIALTYFS